MQNKPCEQNFMQQNFKFTEGESHLEVKKKSQNIMVIENQGPKPTKKTKFTLGCLRTKLAASSKYFKSIFSSQKGRFSQAGLLYNRSRPWHQSHDWLGDWPGFQSVHQYHETNQLTGKQPSPEKKTKTKPTELSMRGR